MSETLSSLLSRAAREGWLINNLFQLEWDLWRASLRNENLCFEFGEGPTPEIALAKALAATGKDGFNRHDKRFPFGPKVLGLEDLGL